MSELDVAAIRARRARWHTLVSRPEPLDADAGTEIDTIADHAVREDVPALLDALAARDARVAELETQLAEADDAANDARLHNDDTCEAVAERDQLRGEVDIVRRSAIARGIWLAGVRTALVRAGCLAEDAESEDLVAAVAKLTTERDQYRTAARSCTVWHGAICAWDAAESPASTAPLAAGHPHVAGRCPACNRASLFLGKGGYVTCAWIDCPNPGAVSDLLDPREATARASAEKPSACPPDAASPPPETGETRDAL